MAETSRRSTRIFWKIAALALVGLGFAVSTYLLARHWAVAGGDSNWFDICQAVFGYDCDAAIRSDLAVQLGIPLAGWGIVYFAVLAVTLLLTFYLGETFQNEGALAALSLCTLATGLGAVLTVMMLSGKAALCPLCFIVHAINLLLIPAILMASGRTIGQLSGSIGQGFQYLVGKSVADPILVRWKVTGLVTAALVGIVAYQWVLIQTDRQAAQDDAPWTFEQVLAQFKAEQEQTIPVSNEDPRRGDPLAKLQLVLFSDFECPACRRFARMVTNVAERHPELSVVFKHYPLSKSCNPAVRRDLHPLSCDAAYAAEAARRQRKFWPYHDALFAATEEIEPEQLAKLAQDTGLDMSRFKADLADPETKARIDADVALGRKLKIKGTPTAFLKGKRLSTRGLVMLDQLVEHETGHSGG
jgi:protein-disulfide isomerase/uncharacterized membrane protein